MSKIIVVYYSMYTHIHKMAEAVAEGVREVPGCPRGKNC
jgi:NAD(P)H dehydrogenase (quinone)